MNELPTRDWVEVDTPVDGDLRDVAQTVVGPHAVGTDGIVVGRGHDGDWDVVIPAGPTTKQNTLTAVAATADRERHWFAGSSGVLGMYDSRSGRKFDYSAPGGKTSSWEALAVTGPAGDEQLLVANGSGEVLRATTDEYGCPLFGRVTKPGRGATITGLAFGGHTAYAVDTSGNVFANAALADRPLDGRIAVPDEVPPASVRPGGGRADTDGDASHESDAGSGSETSGDGGGGDPVTDSPRRSGPVGETQDAVGRDPDGNGSTDLPPGDGGTDLAPDDGRLDPGADGATDRDAATDDGRRTAVGAVSPGEWERIGIRNAQVDFHDVAADDTRLLVAGGNGLVYRYDRPCRNWTPVSVSDDRLHGVDIADGTAVVVGEDGHVAERTTGRGWQSRPSPVGTTLTAVALGTPDSVVGVDGTVVEREGR